MDVDGIKLEEGTSIRFKNISPSQIEEDKSQGKCYNCGQKGHMSRMCPTKKKGNGGRFQKGGSKGGWKGKGKPSSSIHAMETEEEPIEEDHGEGSSNGDNIARIRAMIEALDEEDRIEVLGKDF